MKERFLICTALLLARFALGAEPANFEPISTSLLDPPGFTQWLDGKEKNVAEGAGKSGPSAVVWTKTSKPDWQGVKFGEGLATGVRHLRIGFREGIAIGSVLVRGGGVLSVLKADALYPGQMADDTQWLPAERLMNGEVSIRPVDNEGYALWVLPPGTKPRALRFSHSPAPGDREMAGWLGGLWISEQRLANVAPQALVRSQARDYVSAK